MTSVTDAPGNPLPFSRPRSGRTIVGRAIGWLRANLFASISRSIVTLLLIFVLAKAARRSPAMGILERDLDRSRQRHQRLPGDSRTWRLLGRDPRKISLHPVRHLSVRPAMAAGAGDAVFIGPVLCVEPAPMVAQGAGAGVGHGAHPDRPVDVGWHPRTALCVPGPLGRAAGDADPRDLRARIRLSARDYRRPWPPFKTTRDPIVVACSMSS